MDNTNIFKEKMTNIADAIRETGKTSDLLTIDEMSAKIKLIPSDGGYYTMDDFGQFMASGNFPENSELFIDGTIYLQTNFINGINLPFTFNNLTIKEIRYTQSFPSSNYVNIITGAQGNTFTVNRLYLGKQGNRLFGGQLSTIDINFHKIYLPFINYNYLESCVLYLGMGDSHILDMGEKQLYIRELNDFTIYLSRRYNNVKRAIVFRNPLDDFSKLDILCPITIPDKSLDKTYIFVPDNKITDSKLLNSPAYYKLKDRSSQLLPLSQYREEDF